MHERRQGGKQRGYVTQNIKRTRNADEGYGWGSNRDVALGLVNLRM